MNPVCPNSEALLKLTPGRVAKKSDTTSLVCGGPRGMSEIRGAGPPLSRCPVFAPASRWKSFPLSERPSLRGQQGMIVSKLLMINRLFNQATTPALLHLNWFIVTEHEHVVTCLQRVQDLCVYNTHAGPFYNNHVVLWANHRCYGFITNQRLKACINSANYKKTNIAETQHSKWGLWLENLSKTPSKLHEFSEPDPEALRVDLTGFPNPNTYLAPAMVRPVFLAPVKNPVGGGSCCAIECGTDTRCWVDTQLRVQISRRRQEGRKNPNKSKAVAGCTPD